MNNRSQVHNSEAATGLISGPGKTVNLDSEESPADQYAVIFAEEHYEEEFDEQ